MMRPRTLALVLPLVSAACGGIAVFDDGSGGAGTTSGTSATTKGTTASTKTSTAAVTTNAITTGGAFCDSHDDCDVLSLCSFVTGRCVQTCGPGSPPCPPDVACLPCGTSSCPKCDDCRAVCGETF